MPRTAGEVQALFVSMGFEEVKLPGTAELTFERETKNPDVKIRALSSVVSGLGGSATKPVGTDAGRVQVSGGNS